MSLAPKVSGAERFLPLAHTFGTAALQIFGVNAIQPFWTQRRLDVLREMRYTQNIQAMPTAV